MNRGDILIQKFLKEMNDQTNRRVTALQSFKDGVMRTYGDGVYLGDKIPDVEPFKSMNRANPCIKLDSGKYVWGFQCWWGDVDRVRDNYKDHITETIVVDVEEEILPL